MMTVEQHLNLYRANNLDNTIDHYNPQNPKGHVHTDEFKEKYLHNIGNMALSTRGKNSSDGNKTGVDKGDVSVLLSFTEMTKTKTGWWESEIKGRQEKIVKFATDYWNSNNVEVQSFVYFGVKKAFIDN